MCISVPSGRRVYLFFLVAQQNMHSWHHGKIKDRQGTNWNRQKWCCCQSKNFIRTRDAIRHLQTFRVISNEMPVLVLILCWCYFSCLKKYSDKFLMLTFMRKCFLKSLLQMVTQLSIFWKKITSTVTFSLTNFHVSWRSWF